MATTPLTDEELKDMHAMPEDARPSVEDLSRMGVLDRYNQLNGLAEPAAQAPADPSADGGGAPPAASPAAAADAAGTPPAQPVAAPAEPTAEQLRIAQLEAQVNLLGGMILRSAGPAAPIAQQPQQPQRPTPETIDAEIGDIAAKVEAGDITIHEYTTKLLELTAQKQALTGGPAGPAQPTRSLQMAQELQRLDAENGWVKNLPRHLHNAVIADAIATFHQRGLVDDGSEAAELQMRQILVERGKAMNLHQLYAPPGQAPVAAAQPPQAKPGANQPPSMTSQNRPGVGEQSAEDQFLNLSSRDLVKALPPAVVRRQALAFLN